MKNEIWQKQSTANLVRYVPSGTYFVRAKVHGKLIRESLETDVLTVARLKLADRLKELRNQPAIKSASKMTFADAAAAFTTDIEARAKLPQGHEDYLKPLSLEYRQHTLAAISRTVPGIDETDLKSVTDRDCEAWANKIAMEYGPSRYNGMIQTLQAVFNVAVKQGAVASNPANGLKPARVKSKGLTLPSQEQFVAILKVMDKRNYLSPCSADLVRLLAYSGMRKSEARNLFWSDVDFEKKQITVKGDPEHGTKNSEIRTVPMIADLESLLRRRHKRNKSGRVVPLNECRYSLETACEMVKSPRITHHDLRHLFATRCIESGVDIPTVSRWLGHKDGGKLAMKTYGHLRDEHSVAMAQKVSFTKAAKVR